MLGNVFESTRRRGRAGVLHIFGLLVAVGLGVAAPVAAQQTGTISGVVRSANGQTLGEVVVAVVGTDFTGLTNAEGRYLILGVPAGDYELTASFIGYGQGTQATTLAAGGSATVDFTLQTRAVQLEGVVVTGTAIASQRREVGNSIDLITAEDIEASGVTNVEDILRGRIQGLTIQGSSATPGAGSNINIRGITSINGRTTPLIYLDGVRIGNETGTFDGTRSDGGAATVLNSISPQDIERIEVIKGAAASSLYGTDASAGVIQIFTKRGSASERTQWTVSSQTSLVTPSFVGPGEDIDPTGLHLNRCDIDGPIPTDPVGPDPDCPASGSWLKNAISQNLGVQARGGSDAFTYFVSGNFERQSGIVNVPDEFDSERADNTFLRANFGFDPFDELQLQFNTSYTNRDIIFIPNGANEESLMYNVSRLDQGNTPGDQDAQVFLQERNQVVDQYTMSAAVNWQPMDNMRHRLNVGFDQVNSNFVTEFKNGHFGDNLLGDPAANGARTIDIETSRQITLDYAGSWLWEIPGLNDYSFTTSWGGQLNDRQEGGLRGDASGFLLRGNTQTEQAEQIDNLNESYEAFINGGFFLQQQIGWNNQVFVTGGFRLDSYNRINERLDSEAFYQVFPKVQATYTMSDHLWWPSDVVETFRLRGAWGTAGDPPSQIAARSLWDIRGSGRNANGFVIDQIGNLTVGPEETTEWEVGLDASALNGRLNLSGQYFRRETVDGIINLANAPSFGTEEPTAFNIGEWATWGYEATVDANLIELDNFRWNMNATYQFLDNEVFDIGNDPDGTFDIDPNATGGFRPGDPFPSIYRRVITNRDEIGQLPQYTDTAVFIGVAVPPQEFSLNTSFQLGSRFTIDLFGFGQFGHKLVDTQALQLAEDALWGACVDIDQAMAAWRDAGADENNVPAFRAGDIARCDSGANPDTEDWYDDGDFFRWQSAALQYRLPEDWLPIGIRQATVQLRAQNLAIFTDFNGTDPDAIRGSGAQGSFRRVGFIMPQPRQYQLNIRLGF